MNRAPYKYFDYYTSADADLFFGREKETQMMVGEILSSRLLVLFARSGSGKTSLINAGVVPELKRRGYETLYVRFKSDPLTSLQNATREQLQHAGAANDLRGLLQNVTAARKKPLVVFLDQFEEFFLVFADQPALRQDFMAQIAAVKYDEQLPVFLVLSLREDYYASLHEFRSAIPSIFQNNANIRLGAFTDDEAKRAILLPLAAVGLQMEAGLAEKIIHDLKPSRNGQERREDNVSGIEPITLQIVCHKLWQMKPKDAATITAVVYEKCGGTQRILRNHVSELLQKIPQRQQGLVVRIFEALKTRDNTKLYRRLQDLQETLRLRDSRRLKNALQKLTEIGVLRHEQRSGDDWYEFKHDYLVPEITKWIQTRREKINQRRVIYAITPGVALLFGLLIYLFIQYNSFYAGTVTPENVGVQEEEIAIFRENPFHQVVVTTGYLLSEARNDSIRRALKNHFELGFRRSNDWAWLPAKLEKIKGAITLYQLGKVQIALDTLVTGLKDQDSDVRYQAADALGNLGKSDDRVISALVAALKDQEWKVRRQAAAALVNLGHRDDRVISALVAALKDQKWQVREQVADALGNLGKSDDRVISVLIVALKDKYRDVFDFPVRRQAANALVNLGHRDDRVISALVAALKDQDSDVRCQAADVLGNLGHSDDRVISALVAALKDQDSDVRSVAADALNNLGQSNDRVISALVAALKDQKWQVRNQAAAALINLGQSDDHMISALFAAIKDQYPYVRRQAAAALINLGQSDDRVISVLLAALKDQSSGVRRQAAEALGNLGHNNDRVISELLTAIKDKYSYVRGQAAAALGNLGHSDDRVLSALLAALKDQEWDVRRQVAAALGNLGHNDDRVISALVTALEDQYSYVRGQVAEALENLGHSDDRVISALVAALKDQDYFVRSQAAAALVNLGHSNDHMISVLLAALKDQDSDACSQAAAILGNLGQSDDRVIPALVAALKDQDSDVRSQAAAALGNLGHSDDRVLSALLAALKDQDSRVHSQVAAVLGNLLKPKFENDLFQLLSNNLSGYRTIGAQALARKDSLPPVLLKRVDQLRKDDRPWVRLAAWDTYELIQTRLKSEAEARKRLRQADSLFASGQWSVVSCQ